METIQITNLSVVDLQRLLKQTIQEAKQEWEQQQKAPSDWEELTLEQAAIEMNCSTRTVRRKMRECKIKGYRVGRHVTIQRKDLKKIRSASETRES
jgi:excisionase family DNA binding protein